MVKRTEHKRTFPVKDGQGKTHQLHEFVDIIAAGHMGDPNAEREGLHSYRTEAGRYVNALGKGRYQIVDSGEVLAAVDAA
jgi:hypothetical protein